MDEKCLTTSKAMMKKLHMNANMFSKKPIEEYQDMRDIHDDDQALDNEVMRL